MATSITAAGIVFPDSSVQTTAASASGGTTEAIASGSLSNGSTVVINANGTVSVVAGAAQAIGTAVVFESATTESTSSAYDTVNNKVVIAYQDGGNSSYGTAVVGTVSGTSISFGTPVVFQSGYADNCSAVYDSTNGKIVISFRGISDHGRSVVGTVSGTSISFGSVVTFRAAASSQISSAYDVTNNRVVVAYRGNLNYGTAIVGTVSGTSISFGSEVTFYAAAVTSTSTVFDTTNGKTVIAFNANSNGRAIVGTVSGTSISFGSDVVYQSASVDQNSTVYDITSGKIIIAYQNSGNSFYGTVVVGTVSGTSISFGTPVVFENASTSDIGTAYNPVSNRIIISYQDGGNSNYGTAIVGTVSGTSISFGTAVVFESANTAWTDAVYATNNKVVIAYRDNGNSNYGTSIVFQTGFTNLTAENYIGISDGAYADTATATIQIAGAVDDAQTGLTPGQAYYVQTDGTLGLTPGTPSVFAGTAIAATKIVVQG